MPQRPLHRTRCRLGRHRWTVLAAVLGVGAIFGAEVPAVHAADRETLRLGFTYSMFAGVNESDAKASLRALAATVARERGIPADPNPTLLTGTAAVAAAVRSGAVDAVGMTTDEYWALAGEVQFDRFLMAVKNNDPTEQYLVLVHRDSGLKDLADLRGKRLSIYDNPRMCLAPVWLEVLLAKAGLAPLPDHFGPVTELPKLSKTVLNVFFRQTDACLISRRGFETMTEMNPQVGSQLVVLATSVAVVPSIFGFRTDFSASLKETCLREFGIVHTSPAGQQALTIFQVGQVAERPVAALASALALLDDYARLRPAASAARVAALRRKDAINTGDSRP